MSHRVFLRDIKVLEKLDLELSKFYRGASTTLENVARDIKFSQEYLRTRIVHWQVKLRERQSSYDACRHNRKRSCHAEASAVREAQEALEKLKRLSARLEQAIGEYRPHASRLQQCIQTKITKARGDLHRSTLKYQNYLAHQRQSFQGGKSSGSESNTSKAQLRFGELNASSKYDSNDCEYQTDELGRVNFVYGKLRLEKGVRTKHQQEVGELGLKTDEGGHWIAARFDGSSEGLNLFPQDSNFNRGVYKRMENEWANALEVGKRVEVAIQPVYLGGNRPVGVDVYYIINGKSTTKVFFNERLGGLK